MSEFRMNVQMLLFMYVHVHFSMLQPYKIKLWVQLKGRFSGLSQIFFQVVRSGERPAREKLVGFGLVSPGAGVSHAGF